MSDDGQRRAAPRGCASFVGLILVIVLGLFILVDTGIGSFVCMDSQEGTCGWPRFLSRVPFYLVGVGVIALVVYVLRRLER